MKLLLAEDEQDLAHALSTVLSYNHYTVEVVYDGEDALYYAQNSRYDGIILDIMMPKKSGLDVLKQLRAENNVTPILLLTAKNQVEDKIEGLDMGADDYLAKPFEMKELLARVRALLRRPQAYLANHLEHFDLSLNRDTYTLTVADRTETLTNKEFQLLEYFLMNPSQVFSKEVLMERVWGLDSDAEINVVWVNISSLRKKLQALQSRVKILSVRGVGYRLEEEAHD